MRRRTPQGRWGRICVLLLQAAAIACGGADESVPEPALEKSADAGRANTAPEIVSVELEPRSPTARSAVRARAEVRDRDGDPVKMTYEWTLRGEPVGNGTSKLVLGDVAIGDEFQVRVIASDGRAESEPVSAWGNVGNRKPEIRRIRVGPSYSVTAGEIIEARAEGSDPEGAPVEAVFTWYRNGEEVEGQGPEFDTSGLDVGDVVVVEARMDDGTDLSDPLRSPDIQITNRPPRVVSRPGPSSPERGFEYQVVAEDPDGDAPLRFELEAGPAGMQIGAHSGEVRWRPQPDQSGRHHVRVVVDDLKGGRVAHAFDVDVGGATAPPAAEAP